MSNLKLYRLSLSGHSHRAQLFASLLGLDVELIDVDLMNGEHKQPDYLAKNIFGQVPVLEDGDLVINDSNGILVYLAQKYDDSQRWYPQDPAVQAEIQRFLSVAAGQVAFGPAAARLVTLFGAQFNHEDTIARAHALFATLDKHLEGREWLVGDQASIADVANFSYIEHSPEGGVSLEDYPNIRRWLQNVRTLDGFVEMPASKVGLAA